MNTYFRTETTWAKGDPPGISARFDRVRQDNGVFPLIVWCLLVSWVLFLRRLLFHWLKKAARAFPDFKYIQWVNRDIVEAQTGKLYSEVITTEPLP